MAVRRGKKCVCEGGVVVGVGWGGWIDLVSVSGRNKTDQLIIVRRFQTG